MRLSFTINEFVFKNIKTDNSVLKYNYSTALILNNCKDYDSFCQIIRALGFKISYSNFSLVYYEGEFNITGNTVSINLPIGENYGVCIVNHNYKNSQALFDNATVNVNGGAGASDIYTGAFHKNFVLNAFKAFCNYLFVEGESLFIYKKYSVKSCTAYINKILDSIRYSKINEAKNFVNSIKNYIYTKVLSVEESVFILTNVYRVLCDEYCFDEKDIFDFVLFDFNASDFDNFLNEVLNTVGNVSKNSISNNLYKYHGTITEVLDYINSNFSNDIKLKDVAEFFNMKPGYLSILFKNVFKCTFTDYIMNLRMEKAKDILQNTNLSVGEIYDEVGYTDYYSFIKAFKKYVGVSPTVYRKNFNLK